MGFYATSLSSIASGAKEEVYPPRREKMCVSAAKPSGEDVPPSKNRVWDFSEPSRLHARHSAPQVLDLHRENRSIPTIIVSGVRYYGYRYLHPELGRWMSRDPMGEEGGLNAYEFVGNDTASKIDYVGLYSCKSRALAGRDPDILLTGGITASGDTSSCAGRYSQEAKTGWFPPSAICNTDFGYPDMNTGVRIWARSSCCRRFRVTCAFAFSATVGQLTVGTRANTTTAAAVSVQFIGGGGYTRIKSATPDSSGRWSAYLAVNDVFSSVVPIGDSWAQLINVESSITAGTREWATGRWLGARFVEAASAACRLEDVGPCN